MKRYIKSADSLVELPANMSAIIEDTMPSNDYIVYDYDIDEDSIHLYADASEDFLENESEEFDEESLDFVAIDAINDWALAIANSVDDEELKAKILHNRDWDWYSGMTFYDGGDRPFTYDGFTYSISLEE